ncbi:nitrate ABC transporter permease [Azoarcus sp. KH32C]|uniref:nitrate ABC transporter permease n=1 Tax=Azoarcus sp. KH32C TaxID=748247 RepID=UPI00023866DA|nr:nitrate ABC transporter permease [Azoarcus sp. KH32C]BAL23166.1 assimilatory nitrate transport system, permease protein [Azoarcus sp. KH32C]
MSATATIDGPAMAGAEVAATKVVDLKAARAGAGKGEVMEAVAEAKAADIPVVRRKGNGAAWLRAIAGVVLPPIAGLALMVGLWYLATLKGGGIPGPVQTWDAAVKIFSDPFYRAGPNDQGIGWNVLSSLQRVAIGFGIAALVGIPAGFMLGRFAVLAKMMNPIISLLRPVSPLAWLPIGLLVFQRADPAATWTIFICSIWPMILNTAQGVTRVPQDYLNVARVLNLSEWKIFTKILFPAVLPYMLTGIRLSIGTAWLVIVAAEMLTGGVGIGFWVWDEWNNLKVEHIIIAIFVIGTVGLILEQALMLAARRFNYENR